MSTHKNVNIICVAAMVLSMLLSVLLLNGEWLGLRAEDKSMGYEETLFDTSKVHTLDIVMDDWDSFLSTAQSEEYTNCSVVIDGEAVKNVAIRGKGNTSLSTVASMDSDRYSFKLEFDHYNEGQTYRGLDKLCLNNTIQDTTYMKDYLSYTMMKEFGVNAPLCSYVFITVNGQDWGLYLAVEAVEESFLQRNYGKDYGELYKPDSMSFGGGRGNGKDFDMDKFNSENSTSESPDKSAENAESSADSSTDATSSATANTSAENGGSFSPPDGMPSMGDRGNMSNRPNGGGKMSFSVEITKEDAVSAFEKLGYDTALLDSIDFENTSAQDLISALSALDGVESEKLMQELIVKVFSNGGNGGGFSSDDVKLQYIDDNASSYSNIFDNAKTQVSSTDKKRLISSLKSLSSFENLESVLDIDEVLRYFVVHSFVVNGDSYTGMMIHNYYLYEKDGQLAMIPWDYNLAYGTFQGGSASSSVNDAIDSALSDRPMQAWIFSDESYTQQYKELYTQFLEQVDIQSLIQTTADLIAPYVQKDACAFYTYEEFEKGVEALKQFCALRTESVTRQLAGNTEAVETGDLNLSDMGTMSHNGGSKDEDSNGSDNSNDFPQMPDGMTPPDNMNMGEMPSGAPNGTPPNLPSR